MSDSLFHQDAADRQRGLKTVQCKGTFGSGAVTSSGYGATITRTAAGTYTITTDDSFVALHIPKFSFNANSATPIDLIPQVYSVDQSAKTVKFKLLKPYLSATTTWDVGNLADGEGESMDVTVTGAALGDIAVASLAVDVVDMIVTANVTAANTVTIRVQNETGGAVNLASTTATAATLPVLPIATDPTSGAEIYCELTFRDTEVTP